MGVDRDVYEKADVTGDGVKDKVEIVCNWKGSGQDQFVSKSVKVNGTVIRTLKEYPATYCRGHHVGEWEVVHLRLRVQNVSPQL